MDRGLDQWGRMGEWVIDDWLEGWNDGGNASYILFACQVKKNFNIENDPAFSAQTTINFNFDF